jgi:serine/threonine protein kinase
MASDRATSSTSVRFGGDFEFHLRSFELKKAGQVLKLERIPTELLCLLIQNRGELVTRDQIVERVWGKSVFLDSDNSINAAVRKIRQVLGDDPAHPRFVQTLTGRGYRFIAEVEKSGAIPAAEAPPPAHEGDPLPGKRISHYRLIRLLGGGGMGLVYEGEDLKLARRVAVKLLPAELASEPGAFERFEREARAASSLDHPNICSIYQLGDHQGQPFIVMQLLEGMTLREWIEAGTGRDTSKRLRELVDYAIQIADGLDAAHQKGIIHRDVKPANIFITHRGQAKILDFGVAKFVEGVDGAPGVGEGLPRRAPSETLRVPPPRSEHHLIYLPNRSAARNSIPERICFRLGWFFTKWPPASVLFPAAPRQSSATPFWKRPLCPCGKLPPTFRPISSKSFRRL